MTRSPFTSWPGSRSTCPSRIRSRSRKPGVQHARLDAAEWRSGGRRAGGRLHDLQHAVRRRREPGALLEEHRHGEVRLLSRERIHDQRSKRHARARRHPERRPAPAADSVCGDLHRAPHRRSQSGAGIDAAPERSGGLGRRPDQPAADTWVSVALTYTGLKALGVPQEFARQLRLGVPAGHGRARESAGRHRREQPRALGKAARDAGRPRRARRRLARLRSGSRRRSSARARRTRSCRGSRRSGGRTATRCPPKGSRSGSGTASAIRPSKAAAFPEPIPASSRSRRANSSSATATRWAAFQMPQPEVLGRNGTYVVFRKLHQRVAAFRQYLKANSISPEDEELLAAKMMGRWRSGAPLALCPFHDDPELGADPRRNNDFLYQEDDPTGYKTPGGSHIRRANPRDAPLPASSDFTG